MKRSFLGLLAICGLLASAPSQAAPFERVANTTLKLPANPPALGYTTTNAFTLTFTQPVALVTPQGETNRLFVVEQPGRIAVITNLANPTRSVFLDISARIVAGGEQGLLGLAFHPDYAANGFFYVFYTLNTTTAAGTGRHDRLSRFQVSPTNPNQAQADSEQVMITQFDDYSNHNGGDLHFGADGYLYVSLGDEGDQNDRGNNSQRIDKDFFSGMLRIDVDQRPGNPAPNPHPAVTAGTYSVPADNPWVGATTFNGVTLDPGKVRTEFYAVGLRNPWRFSFDRATGRLYCGDVGGDLREEINIIVKGGNYGWAFREGTVNGPKASQAPAGFTSIPPIQQYNHGSGTNQGNSVTGGVVYRGQRFPELAGGYLFADYVSGNVWVLRYDGTNTVPFRQLTREPSISAFGFDPRDGEVLMADLADGRLKRLAQVPRAGSVLPPATLSETGAFADLLSLTPQAGVVPYELNLPFWSDGAHKRRWFAMPDTDSRIEFSREGNWGFPAGMTWVKHFDLELTNGVPESTRRIETRFLVKTTNGVYGLTYRWDDSQTNAVLVPENGLDETFTINDGGSFRQQVWQYPSRASCLTCHTPGGGFALGFNTAQVNRDGAFGGVATNQIAAWSQAGYFREPVTNRFTLRAHVTATNEFASLESRVRSYLAVNCAGCHQPGGTGVGLFDARFSTVTGDAGIINGPLNNNRGSEENAVVRPGWPQFSQLLQRISVRGPGQMPPLASTVVDTNSVRLLTDWITKDALDYESLLMWQVSHFDEEHLPDAAPDADPDQDGASNYLEFLVGTSPVLSLDPWRVGITAENGKIQIRFPKIARRGFEVQVSENPGDPASWRPLDVPSNRPFFAAQTVPGVIEDDLGAGSPKFYRVRVFEQ